MPRVNGLLSVVTEAPETVTEVIVRAPEPRAAGSGLVTVSPVVVRVEDGVFDAVLAPGPCVLTLLSAGVPVGQVHLLVPDGPVSLRTAFEAALAADTGTRDVLERLAVEAAASVEAAAGSAELAAGSASASADSAAESGEHAGRAVSASEAAAGHEAQALEFAGRAREDMQSASAHAVSAAESADTAVVARDGAAESATLAESSAERAGQVAESTSWSGDQLTVNGKTSPPLTGPRGPRGEATPGVAIHGEGTPPVVDGAHSLAVGWAAVANQPYASALGSDSGASGYYASALGSDSGASGYYASALGSDSGASGYYASALGSGSGASGDYSAAIAGGYTSEKATGSIALGAGQAVENPGETRIGITPSAADSLDVPGGHGHIVLDGTAEVTRPGTKPDHVARKGEVDDVRGMVETRPAFFSGAGAPPASIPGAVVGDYYLDESTMELHKITGV